MLEKAAVRARRVVRGVFRLFRLPIGEILTTLHAAAIMMWVELLIRSMPLPRLSRALGCRVDLEAAEPGAQRLWLKELPPRSARQVRCTRRVAQVWPFTDGPCLRSALVTGHLLRDLDPAIRLGMVKTDEEMHAHAWVEIDGRPLDHVAAYDVFQSQSDRPGRVDSGNGEGLMPEDGPDRVTDAL